MSMVHEIRVTDFNATRRVATPSDKHLTWVGPGPKLGLCGERPETNPLTNGTAWRVKSMYIMKPIYPARTSQTTVCFC